MTNRLYDLVKESRSNNEALETVIELFEPKLKKSLYMTNPNDREDLAQELKLKMISYITEYDVDAIPGFWEIKEKTDKARKKRS